CSDFPFSPAHCPLTHHLLHPRFFWCTRYKYTVSPDSIFSASSRFSCPVVPIIVVSVIFLYSLSPISRICTVTSICFTGEIRSASTLLLCPVLPAIAPSHCQFAHPIPRR